MKNKPQFQSVPRAINRRSALFSAGFTLIEMMIALLITLFLIAGLVVMVIGTRGTFKVQDQLQITQENERFALFVLGNSIRPTGYYINPTTTTAISAFPINPVANPDGTTFVAAQSLIGTSGSATGSDTLNVRFQSAPNDGLSNCVGDRNISAAAITWTNSFAINASNQLTCAASVNGGTPGTSTVLVDNVASMKVLYGVDTVGDGSAHIYIDASAFGATYFWGNVKSVKINITFQDLISSTTGAPVSLPPISHTINLMNQS